MRGELPPGIAEHYLGADLPPREHAQLVSCLNCGYFRRITVQNRRGGHGCMNCGQQMEVWEPRPDRFGGLLGEPVQPAGSGGGPHDNADYGKPVGDAIRTSSIEAATRAILDAPERPAWHHRGAESREERAERLAAVAVDAVLGVAMPSIRRDALGEAIDAAEAAPVDHPNGGNPKYGSEVRADILARLRGLRDTQAPSG